MPETKGAAPISGIKLADQNGGQLLALQLEFKGYRVRYMLAFASPVCLGKLMPFAMALATTAGLGVIYLCCKHIFVKPVFQARLLLFTRH